MSRGSTNWRVIRASVFRPSVIRSPSITSSRWRRCGLVTGIRRRSRKVLSAADGKTMVGSMGLPPEHSSLRGWFELVFAVVPHLPFSFPRDFAKVQCVIITILAPTTPCASLVPTNELPASRLYRQPHGRETFPALHPRPCDRAAAPTPESSSVASARLFPENPAFAIQIQARRSPPARLPSRG